MEWSQTEFDSLYELYQRHFQRLRADVVAANQSLESNDPQKTWMEMLGRQDFERLITATTDEPDMVRRWLKCIIRGHEHEYPQLRVA